MSDLGYPCHFLFVKYCNSFHHCWVEDNRVEDNGAGGKNVVIIINAMINNSQMWSTCRTLSQ